jgi:transketolase
MQVELRRLESLAAAIRTRAVQMVYQARSAHIGSSLSMADLLAALYGCILRVDPSRPDLPERDRFILSKGHACAALYAVLSKLGFFPDAWLDSFYQDGGKLAGHATHKGVPGIEVSTGSLGHGLSLACGMALAACRDEKHHRIFCLLSDGECDEGSVWEAALFSSHHRLDNLTAVVDYNKIQSLGHVRDVLNLEPFRDKWEAFGWEVREVDGHDMKEIVGALRSLPYRAGRPSCLIAHTVKGKGVSFMEDKLLWHYRNPQEEEFQRAMSELEEKL